MVVPSPEETSQPTIDSHPSGSSETYEPQPDFWVPPGDISTFFDSQSSSIEQSLASNENALSLADQLGVSSQLPGLPSADDEFNALLQIDDNSSTALDMYIYPLLDDDREQFQAPNVLPQGCSAASSMVKFREEMNEHIATIDAYYSNSSKVLQRCKDEHKGGDVSNPAALLLTCSKEFTDIIQIWTSETQLHTKAVDALSTEIALLALSSYLALMRFFDFLFHRIYEYVCQLPPELYQSMKVKSVLRIGGFSSLQDMSLKSYAIGIVDAIRSQMYILERDMGIPVGYCLDDEAIGSPTAAAPGMFSSVQRTRLFWAVMAQEDIKAQRGTKSYVESIRVSIKETMAILHD